MQKLDFQVDFLNVAEVASLFGTTPPKIVAAIKNGTLPIGFVSEGNNADERTRTIIVKQRLEKWLNAEDLSTPKVVKNVRSANV